MFYRGCWHMKRVRIFLEWYAREMQALFASFEEEVSPLVGLPLDVNHPDRQAVYRT